MTTETATEREPAPLPQIDRIAAAVDCYPEGDDAAVLATAIARATGADLLLVTIEPELELMLPGANWRRMRRETERMLARTRASFAPDARFSIDRDLSAARGIKRVIGMAHRQLLVCGSGRRGRTGEVFMGPTTRQLLDRGRCAVAIAPRGLSEQAELKLRRIGVGFDGEAEARAALSMGVAMAAGCGAELVVRGVVDDQIPALGWPNLWAKPFRDAWREAMADAVKSLRQQIENATGGLPGHVSVEVKRDVPSASLCEFSDEVDLLVVGSRRWGPIARLLLGGTGEALVHGARCSLLIVPRQSPRTDLVTER